MQFVEIKDKELWNSWVGARSFSQFLQSWEWGEFHKKMGRKVWRFAIYANRHECDPDHKGGAKNESARNVLDGRDAIDHVSTTDENIMLSAQVIKYNLPLGQSYLYCPRGPIFGNWKLPACAGRETGNSKKIFNVPPQSHLGIMAKEQAITLLINNIKELAKSEGSIFLRVEPVSDNNYCSLQIRVKPVQPENEWFLDLKKSEEELLEDMHQKTRYNIKLAEKKGVKIRKGEGENDFNEFWNLISNTYSRKDIKTHSKEYYEGILEIGDSNNIAETQNFASLRQAQTKLWTSEYENKIIATNIISYFGDTATYMHGSTDYKYRNLMAPYLLQWETIKEAKAGGFKYYNFGGIISERGEDRLLKSAWGGITRFKKGFGGFELNYPGTYNLVIRHWLYEGYRIAKIIKAGRK